MKHNNLEAKSQTLEFKEEISPLKWVCQELKITLKYLEKIALKK